MYSVLRGMIADRVFRRGPIRVGLVGTGQMGTDIIAQVAGMPPLVVALASDLVLSKAVEAYRTAGYDGEVAVVRSGEEAHRAMLAGRPAVCEDYAAVATAPGVDVVIDATGSPEVGAHSSILAMSAHKHVVLMTVETDVTVGPLLKLYADHKGVVYTLAAGDEPAAIMELYDFARMLGFEVVAAGKGKNNPLDRFATPGQFAKEAEGRGLTPEMLVEFVDGTKTNIEMAAVSNATGLVPDTRGMHGPRTPRERLASVFAPVEEGGILRSRGVVDYAIGDVSPGVFLVVRTDQPRLRQCMLLRTMGSGPNYLLLRPYHLCSIETPLSAAAAVLGHSLMAPRGHLTSEVVAVAKRDLSRGDCLERIGGSTHFGVIDTRQRARVENALPVGLAQGATVTAPVRRGDLISYDQVSLPATRLAALRRLQDKWEAGEADEAAVIAGIERMA